MREKYVEEAFGRWFVFGGKLPNVDVADTKGDVFEGISPEAAKDLIAARDRFVDELVQVFTRHPQALIRRSKGAR